MAKTKKLAIQLPEMNEEQFNNLNKKDTKVLVSLGKFMGKTERTSWDMFNAARNLSYLDGRNRSQAYKELMRWIKEVGMPTAQINMLTFKAVNEQLPTDKALFSLFDMQKAANNVLKAQSKAFQAAERAAKQDAKLAKL